MPNLVRTNDLALNAWNKACSPDAQESTAANWIFFAPYASRWQGMEYLCGYYTALPDAISAVGSGVSAESRMILQKLSAEPVAALKYQMEALEQLFTFRGTEAVQPVLNQRPFLMSFLLDAYVEIVRYFPNSTLFLEAFTDPELVDTTEVVLSIATDLDAAKAVDRLEALDYDWWLSARGKTREMLCITIESK